MKLEGIDPRHPQLYTVLSVAEVKGFRLRLHFDGFSESYDFWVNANNPFLFPAGWAEKNGKTLQPPKSEIKLLYLAILFYIFDGGSSIAT